MSTTSTPTTDMQVKPTTTTPAPAPVSTAGGGGTPDVFRAFRGEMDRLFDRFFNGFGLPSFAFPRFEEMPRLSLPSPAVEVTETDAAWTIAAELPGMAETDIEVAISGDRLTLKGEKRQESKRTEGTTTLSERSYGAFERSFMLPEGIDRDKIGAAFTKGVLTLTLPKTETARQQTRKIEVKAAA